MNASSFFEYRFKIPTGIRLVNTNIVYGEWPGSLAKDSGESGRTWRILRRAGEDNGKAQANESGRLVFRFPIGSAIRSKMLRVR